MRVAGVENNPTLSGHAASVRVSPQLKMRFVRLYKLAVQTGNNVHSMLAMQAIFLRGQER